MTPFPLHHSLHSFTLGPYPKTNDNKMAERFPGRPSPLERYVFYEWPQKTKKEDSSLGKRRLKFCITYLGNSQWLRYHPTLKKSYISFGEGRGILG